tara:strand:+ start:32 stop:268 length:237 start_codon:yes stop_codon:yes gene_type:complete
MVREKTPVVVVWRKSKNAVKKYMTVFENVRVDEVLEEKKKPLLDNNYEIDEVGVGLRFIDDWKYKFNINKYNIVKKES